MEYKYCICYGSLRAGEYNFNRIRELFGEESMKYVKTIQLKGFRMYSLGSYPAAIQTYTDEESITCDIMTVSPSVDKYIEEMEVGAGYSCYSETVTVSQSNVYKAVEASIYLFEEDEEANLLGYAQRVHSGDWIKFNTKEALFYENEN